MIGASVIAIAAIGTGATSEGRLSERVTEGAVSKAIGTGSSASLISPSRSERCPHNRNAVRWYRSRQHDWLKLRGVVGHDAVSGSAVGSGEPERTPRKPRNCADARYLADVWKGRSFKTRRVTERWIHHYAWWRWLPSNWQALGACETGYGRRPGNFQHANGGVDPKGNKTGFVSAFGISRSIYDSDAAYFGGPPWNDQHPPTPREQYDAARGHLARFGDGWTCPGP